MPWFNKQPARASRHTVRAQRFDRKADREVARRGDPFLASHWRDKADKAAKKGGWK